MKPFFIILSVLVLIQVSFGQQIPVSVDTINLDVKGCATPGSRFFLTHAIKDHGRYYCFFQEWYSYSYGKTAKKHLFVMTEEGDDIKPIDIPADIENTTYFDFFSFNDSIFVKLYDDRKCYYLDANLLKWEEVKEVDDIVYQDDDYKVTYLYFGEWGQATWFINKNTGIQYILDVNSKDIIKYNTAYYITRGNGVIEIANPELLQKCNVDNYYNKTLRYPNVEISARSGIRYIYTDSGEYVKHPVIVSFIMDEKMYQLYLIDSMTYIGRVMNDTLFPVQQLGLFPYFNWYYSYRGNIKNKLLKFQESNTTYGLIDIDKYDIKITYLQHNLDTLNFLGTDAFNAFLSSLTDNTKSYNLNEICTLEMSIGGTDLTHANSFFEFYWDGRFPEKDFQSKRFVKVISSEMSQITDYVYNKHSNLIKYISLDWEKTQLVTDDRNNSYEEEEKEILVKKFYQKQEEIISIITLVTGNEPYKRKMDKYGTDLYWKLPNGTIQLTYPKNYEMQQWIGLNINID